MTGRNITTFRSGLQAAGIAVQAALGAEQGLGFTESLWDSGPADDGCDGMLLAEILRGEGFAVDYEWMMPANCMQHMQRHIIKHRFSLCQVYPLGRPDLLRWCICVGYDATGVDILTCVGRQEEQLFQGAIGDVFTGETVTFREEIPKLHPVVAHIVGKREGIVPRYADEGLN